MKYTQCDFKQGTSKTTGFIEGWAAKVGNEVELPEVGPGFWLITKTGHSMTKEELRDKQAADRKQRQASDI